MFRKRLLTALILIPLVLATIYYANIWVFSAVVLVLTTACALEWLPLIPIRGIAIKAGFILALWAACYLSHLFASYWLWAGLATWCLILVFVYQFPRLQSLWGRPFIAGFFCLVLLPLFYQCMQDIFLLNQGRGLIVWLLCLVWAADTGAYLAGKQWGRNKLLPAVSPGKTWEGVLGGFVLAMLVAVAGCYFFRPYAPWLWFLIAIVVALSSLLGDLFISMLKRRSRVKDTGSMLPGHGGILDRLDSLIAAAVFFSSGLRFLEPGLS